LIDKKAKTVLRFLLATNINDLAVCEPLGTIANVVTDTGGAAQTEEPVYPLNDITYTSFDAKTDAQKVGHMDSARIKLQIAHRYNQYAILKE
jgi:hypothetical protein